MFDFSDSANVGKCYRGFQLISVDELPDYKTKAVYLRHRRTGLEVYHILAEDRENTFAFAFRTFAKDSKGTAHVMEHSTLCGSEKYPLKEPFTTLASTSLNTFLNAMTYPDKTVYPGASVVPADYFNMMDVYADAVFFPKLDHETFIQEGHRLELDEKGELSIQGVVYNEMKGEFSTFMQIANNEQGAAMYPDSFYAYDSGGDPLDIPSLTYKQFLDFHQKFYNPDNCLLFLYGDIPTEKQLDFMADRFMDRIAVKYNCVSDVDNADSPVPVVTDSIKELQRLNHVEAGEHSVNVMAPETGSTGELVSMNWYVGSNDMEKVFLGEVLLGNDSSPMNYRLRESELGDEVSPLSGTNGPINDVYFSFGLSGVKKGNEEKVFSLIKSSLQEVYRDGISQKDIDSAIMGIDFNLREVTRYFGPYSLVLMNKVLNGWNYGYPCNYRMFPISDFEKIKAKAASGPDYVRSLIKKYFIDNDSVVKFVAEPSKEYFKGREKAEKDLIARLGAELGEEGKVQMKRDLDQLHAYQQHVETPEETACIPTTKLSELNPEIEIVNTDLQFVEGADGCKVPVFVNKEATNGIFYFEVLFPFDRIKPEYFQYMPFLSNVMTNMGWNGKKWEQCTADIACVMGDIWGRTCCGSIADAPECWAEYNKYKDYNFCGREWLGVSCKALTSQAEETLKMASEIITTMSFDDKKRFETLVGELKSEKKAGIVSNGVEYSLRRAAAANGVAQALNEIMNGISQLYTIDSYKKSNSSKILKIFKEIYYDCLKAGGIIHITADEDSLNKVMPLLGDFAKEAGITKLLPPVELKTEDLLPYVHDSDAILSKKSKQMICEESQTGYAAAISPASPYLTKDAAAEYVFSVWFRMHTLWDKIRTTGGAYGVSTWADNYTEKFMMYSYRDPTPEKSLAVYIESLKDMLKNKISDDDIEKCIVSVYGDAIVPASPKKRGDYSFDGMIYCNPQKFKQIKVNNILSVSSEDVAKAIERINKWIEQECKTVVFSGESKSAYGKKINLPL